MWLPQSSTGFWESEYSCSELLTLHTTHLTYIGWSEDIICHPNALHEPVANSDLACGLGWLRNYNMFCFIPSKAHAFANQVLDAFCYCGQAKQNQLTWHSSFKGRKNGGIDVWYIHLIFCVCSQHPVNDTDKEIPILPTPHTHTHTWISLLEIDTKSAATLERE